MASEPPPRFRLLGQLEVDGSDLEELRGVKQRTLMAYLLLHAGQIVATDRLITAVWAEDPPPTAAAIIHAYVRRVRSVLSNTDSWLVTQSPGYLFELGGEDLDVRVFERLAHEGRVAIEANEPDRAKASLATALALWRGEFLAELPAEGFVAEERSRLEELRRRARLDRIEAELLLGAGEALVPELELLVREEPFQERPRRQLMLALYRAGRQADALALYRETHRQFSEELGLEPSRELKQLESAILQQDPLLDAPQKTQPDVAGSRRRRSLRALAIAAAVVAVAALVIGIDLAAGTKSQPRPVTSAAPIRTSLDLPQPSCCGFGFNALWGVGHHDDTLRRIDPATGKVTGTWQVAEYQSGVPLAAAGSIWIPSAAGHLVRFDPMRQKVTARIPVSGAEVTFGYLKIWETTRSHQLDEIDLRHNRVVRAIPLAAGSNDGDDPLTIGQGSVWVAVSDTATLVRIDPTSGHITARVRGFGTTDSFMPIAFDQNSVWVLRFVGGSQTVFRVDPATNAIVARIPVGGPNGGGLAGTITAGDGYIWTGNWDDSISKIDERTNRVVGVYHLPALPQNVNFEDGALWVDAYDASKVWRIDPNN